MTAADAFDEGARAMLDALHGDASHSAIENPHDAARGCPCGDSHDAPKGGGRIIPESFASGLLRAFAQESPIAQSIDPCAAGAHRWAWLTAGGQACGRCGVRR